MLSNRQTNIQRLKKQHPTFTRVTHNNNIMCGNSSVYIQNSSQWEQAICKVCCLEMIQMFANRRFTACPKADNQCIVNYVRFKLPFC